MKSGGIMTIVGAAAWLVTGVTAVVVGLRAFDYEVLGMFPALMGNMMALKVLRGVVLVSGILSLVDYARWAMTGSCSC